MDHRPYHAVRDVRIEQRFSDVAAERLGLIDLPGAGEAGLDTDTRFIQQVKNEIDFLLMVKRGVATSATYLGDDSYALRLADSARGGAALEDFYAVVVNRDADGDPSGQFFANTRAEVQAVAQERRITVYAADVVRADEVTAGLLRPVLEHLAASLARMDRANVEAVLQEAGEVAAEVARFADVLATVAERQFNDIPNQEHEFRRLARKLRNDLALSLYALRAEYVGSVHTGSADEPLTRGIGAAVQAGNDWVRAGLGKGDPDAWFDYIQGEWVAGHLEATQIEHYRAMAEITRLFSDVDASLDESIQGLWNRVADALRVHLTPLLVPATPT